MFKEHPIFLAPEDENIKIWRYIDFTKLVSLIDTKKLFFSRTDMFDDHFEGSYPKLNVEARKYVPKDIPEKKQEKYMATMSDLAKTNKQWLKYNAVSCWHINEYESCAMWNHYIKSDAGIAIQSTYNRFKKSLVDDEEIYIGTVNYIDYEKDHFDVRNVLSAFVHKRMSFEHERELRALVMRRPTSSGKLDFTEETIKIGVPIKVNIKTLIERIYVAPKSTVWFAELVKAIIKRYGYDFEIVHSEINKSPLY
ncbi:hypothetical protein ACFLTI_08555 [Bacteroidota bacterium]